MIDKAEKSAKLEEESMNWKIIMILLAAVGSLYSLLLGVVRYFSLKNPTPANLSDVYDAETYEKWKKYSEERSRLEIVSSLVTGVITILLLSTNVYAAFAGLFPKDWFWQLFAVILLETLVGAVVGAVEGYISTMKIEEKYGFNRSSIKTFVADRIRSLIASFALTLLLALLVAVSHSQLGIWMIPAFAVAAFLFSMVASFLYPLISRLGNKFTPLPEGELRDALMKLLDKYGYKVKAIEVMDASRRTTKLNAYFTGFGKMKTIVLYDNLVEAMSIDEICAVFAHELGHGLHKDVQKAQVLNVFQFLLMGALAYILANTNEIYYYFGFISDMPGLFSYPPQAGVVNYGFTYILLGICLGVLQPILGFITNARSRKAEFRADRQAVVEGYGESMIVALKKLARDNFSHLSPSWINVVLEYSHPPIKARIKSIERDMKRYKKSKTKK